MCERLKIQNIQQSRREWNSIKYCRRSGPSYQEHAEYDITVEQQKFSWMNASIATVPSYKCPPTKSQEVPPKKPPTTIIRSFDENSNGRARSNSSRTKETANSAAHDELNYGNTCGVYYCQCPDCSYYDSGDFSYERHTTEQACNYYGVTSYQHNPYSYSS